jgi:16S rRNA (adenine1518-N6/adenine1519-N6)-dimethyltransferase
MQPVKPKKKLGQHFLQDQNIAIKIVDSLFENNLVINILEIGPGTGILTSILIERKANINLIEIDNESIQYLNKHYPSIKNKIIKGDFLKFDLTKVFSSEFSIIGNFPYNISSQILFKVLENRNQVNILVGMFQKEVAERVCAPPKNKTYGILSVLVQAFYKAEYLFTVNENVFIPPPKVKSGVIRIIRNNTKQLNCNEELFFKVVKTGFNYRRKTLKNALSSIWDSKKFPKSKFFQLRAEQLDVTEFIELTNLIDKL